MAKITTLYRDEYVNKIKYIKTTQYLCKICTLEALGILNLFYSLVGWTYKHSSHRFTFLWIPEGFNMKISHQLLTTNKPFWIHITRTQIQKVIMYSNIKAKMPSRNSIEDVKKKFGFRLSCVNIFFANKILRLVFWNKIIKLSIRRNGLKKHYKIYIFNKEIILGSVYTTMAITVERYTTITNSCWKVWKERSNK